MLIRFDAQDRRRFGARGGQGKRAREVAEGLRRGHPEDTAGGLVGERRNALFERICKEYYGRVLNFCLRKGFSYEESEDLTQDTFLKVWVGLPEYRQDGTVKG